MKPLRVGFLAAAGAGAVLLALTPGNAAAEGGAWALLTSDQVIEVEQKFVAGLDAYTEYREGRDEKEKKKRGEDAALTGMLGDLERRNRDDIRRNNRKPANPSEDDRIKDNQRKLPGGGGEDEAEILKQRAERRKSLRDLLVELNAPKDPPLQKYSKQYAGMLLAAYKKDPKKYAEILGEISAGEYGRLPDVVGKASTALVSKAVSDILGAYKYDDAKEIWDAFTDGIADYGDVGSAFLRGDWARFKTGLSELAMKKATAATEDAVATVVGYAFGPLGGSAGKAYVKLVEAEIEFLKWSKRTLDRQATVPCLNRYVETYQRIGGPGAQGAAYDEFKMCSEERGKFIGFAALEAYIVQDGLDANIIFRQLAEDYRTGKVQFVDQWLSNLVESRKLAIASEAQKGWDDAQTRMAGMSSTFNRAASIMINGIIEDVIGEAKLKELDAAAAKALLDTFQDMQLLRRAANGATGACAAYDNARKEAAGILKSSQQTDESAEGLEARARTLPACNSDAAAVAGLKRLYERAQKVSGDFDRERKNAEGEVDAACKAAEAVAASAVQDDARKQLDAANQHAAAAQKSGDAAQAAFRELTALVKRAGEIKLGGDQAARAALADVSADAELIEMGRVPLEQRLKNAQAKMAAALRTVQNLESYAKDQADKIKPVLAPQRSSTLRAQILQAEDEMQKLLDDIADCRRGVADSWASGDDGAPPWRSQKIGTTASTALQTALTAAKAKCPDTPGEDPTATMRAMADLAARADPEAAIIALGKATCDRCVAQAVTAFDGVRAAANAVLTMQAPIADEVKNWAGTWTMSSGSGSMQLYSGEYISKGTYSWTPPPASVGPQGFSVTLTASCETGPKQGSTATGTGISAEGFDLVTSPTDHTPAKREAIEAPVNCTTGQSNSKSVTVYLMPRANYAEGEVAKIKIGAFWGPGVTYRYVAGKPKQ